MNLISEQIIQIAPIFFGILIMITVWFSRKFERDIKPKTIAFILSVLLCSFGYIIGIINGESLVSTILTIGTSAVGTYEIFKKYISS